MDIDVFPVFQTPGVRRERSKPTSEIQEKLNQRNAERRISRIANLNFTNEDLVLHLTYEREPESLEDAMRLVRNYLRRIARRRKKAGLPALKYLLSTERGRKSGRLHHHLFISGGLDRDCVEALWGLGRANTRRLQAQEDGFAGLASYMAKNKISYKRWSGSRNLLMPEPAEIDGRLSCSDFEELGEAAASGLGHRELEALYPGWDCCSCEALWNEWNASWYVRAVMRRKN